ncbi:MAG TPA: radical SAM protein [Anaerovoracaceae bacterium]|nr:radical SAM protein [Anaerovoracaceae bacterium]
MKILLTTLNSKYVHSNLALKYLYASAEKSRNYIDIQEFTINNEEDYIFTELLRKSYDVICFSCYIWNVDKTLYLAENLKKARPEIRILLGGPEVSYDVIPFMSQHKFIDFIISGEGEAPFAELTETLLSDTQEFDKIRGLTYRMDGKLYVNPIAPLLSFESVPFPYLNLVCEEDKVMYYESARGCPFQCSYCLSSLDRKVRTLSMERAKSDLSYFIYKRVKQVKFIDRTFNWDKKRCYEIMKYLIASDNGVTNFHLELCGDLLDEELLQLLSTARPGLFQFEIGVQSTNESALRACNRNSDFAKLAENVKRLIELDNIHIHLDLIAGLPNEDYPSFRKSFNEVYSLKGHQLQLGFLKLIKGTPIREQAEEHEYVYRGQAPYEIISSKYISALALIRLKKIENVLELYYNRGGFKRTLDFTIENLAETPFDFYEELADYFYLKGFQHKSHKKEDLYRIYLLYAGWKERFTPNMKDKIKELLILDMQDTLNPEAIKKFERKGWEIL